MTYGNKLCSFCVLSTSWRNKSILFHVFIFLCNWKDISAIVNERWKNATKFHKDVIDAHSNNTIIACRKVLQIIIRFHFCIQFLLNERIRKEINWFSRKLFMHILEHQNKKYETCNFLMKSLKLFTLLFYQIIWEFNGIERLPDW